MKGINLLPTAYKRQLQRQNVEKAGILILAFFFIGSILIMAIPYYKLYQRQNELEKVIYRLQDSQFYEVEQLQQEEKQLQELLMKRYDLIKGRSTTRVLTEELLYNLLSLKEGGLKVIRIGIGEKEGLIIVEGVASHQEDVMHYVRRVETIYPQYHIKFHIENIGGEQGFSYEIQMVSQEEVKDDENL